MTRAVATGKIRREAFLDSHLAPQPVPGQIGPVNFSLCDHVGSASCERI